MKKSVKFSLMLIAISTAATAWGAVSTTDTTAGDLNTSTSGVATTVIAPATSGAVISEAVTVKLSKGVMGSFDLTKGGGAIGVATGTPKGKGWIYPNGTSSTSTSLAPISKGSGASVTQSDILTAASAAAS